jgi:hypothetical protein
MDEPYVIIKWNLGDNVPVEGVSGIDSERVPLRDLVKWARKNRRRLRRNIRRGYVAADARDRKREKEQAEQARRAADQEEQTA